MVKRAELHVQHDQYESLDAEASTGGQRVTRSEFTMVRVADNVTCEDVRALTFP